MPTLKEQKRLFEGWIYTTQILSIFECLVPKECDVTLYHLHAHKKYSPLQENEMITKNTTQYHLNKHLHKDTKIDL